MRYQVVTTRSVGNAPAQVVATTRRFNGAVAEADRWLDSAYRNARKHCPDGHVVRGPHRNPNTWSVVSLYPDGTTVVDTVTVVQVSRQS